MDTAATHPPAEPQVLDTCHVLVIEDDPQLRRFVMTVLQGVEQLSPAGIETVLHAASCGTEAVALATRLASTDQPIAHALVDFHLGDGPDGIEIAEQLWRLDPGVQCTLVTGDGELGEKQTRDRIPPEFVDQWDFLSKPITPFEIIQRARRSLSSWTTQRRHQRLRRQLETTVRERTSALEERNSELEAKNSDVRQALDELAAAQNQLLQNEKMASIGLLAAGVAHDLNNPIGFVHSNLGTLRRYCEKIQTVLKTYDKLLGPDTEIAKLRSDLKFDFLMEDLPMLVDESLEGTERVTKIVTDLKAFSRPAENEAKYTDLIQCIESTLNIVHNELKYKATVVRDFADVPQVFCVPGQINQVLMNLLVNAAQAMTVAGEIRLAVHSDGDHVVISVSDTGCGIPEEIHAHVLDPFFTTKEVGEGSGLGLSISFGIVRRHGGTLSFVSEVGKGTTFEVRLPVAGGEMLRVE